VWLLRCGATPFGTLFTLAPVTVIGSTEQVLVAMIGVNHVFVVDVVFCLKFKNSVNFVFGAKNTKAKKQPR